MARKMSRGTTRVHEALAAGGFDCPIVHLEDSAHTARDAASALGCDVAQICKSLVFTLQRSGGALLVVASGVNRVDERRIAGYLGEPLAKADADFVREHTGYTIGGVAPIGHPGRLVTLLDEDLQRYRELWAAAGHPRAVFRLAPQDLQRMTGARFVRIT